MNKMEQLYQTENKPWGDRPLFEIESNLHLFENGKVLDLGVGDGRNAIYLAQQGFHITGIDSSPTAIKQLLEHAAELNLSDRIIGITKAIEEYETEDKFETVICNFTLHFLLKEQFHPVIKKMMDWTEDGGLHIISDFTRDGPMYSPEKPTYWLKSGELPELYSNWNVLFYNEEERTAKQKDADGNNFKQMSVVMVARKM